MKEKTIELFEGEVNEVESSEDDQNYPMISKLKRKRSVTEQKDKDKTEKDEQQSEKEKEQNGEEHREGGEVKKKRKMKKRLNNPYSKKNLRKLVEEKGLRVSPDSLLYALTLPNPRQSLEEGCIFAKIIGRKTLLEKHLKLAEKYILMPREGANCKAINHP